MKHVFHRRSGFAAIAVLAALALSDAKAQSSPDPECKASTMILPSGALYPNGIARANNGALYVGLVTSGKILSKRPDQDWQVFFEGNEQVFSGTTLRLDEKRGLLWGNSPDFIPSGETRPHRIFAIETSTGKQRVDVLVPNGGMGNDIALAPDGTVFLTETKNGGILRLQPDTDQLQAIVSDGRLNGGTGGIGAAGIVYLNNQTLIVSNFGTGKLYVVNNVDTETPTLREIQLPRLIENPDGMALAADGSLIVLENAINSGQGRILRIREPLAADLRNIEVLRDGLENPVNLTISPQGCAFISEARIRHRLLPGMEANVPDEFRILELPLPSEASDDAQ